MEYCPADIQHLGRHAVKAAITVVYAAPGLADSLYRQLIEGAIPFSRNRSRFYGLMFRHLPPLLRILVFDVIWFAAALPLLIILGNDGPGLIENDIQYQLDAV
jgi:hypothetical protein